ncbi:MAG TPA: hypothetical protein VFV94_21675 [Polyangiaceae bacterium]|nr:hypothetical protein [Polyangiaceae bacterium]
MRPQPPPELVANARASNAEEQAVAAETGPNEEAREQAMNEERRRLRSLPERRRGGDRDMKNANRWVKERVNVRGMGRFQAHGHARGR